MSFSTADPKGTDFRLGLTLHDSVDTSFNAPPFISSPFSAASAFAAITSGPAGVSGLPLMVLNDSASQNNSTGLEINHPPASTVYTVIHVDGSSRMILTGFLRVSAATSNSDSSASVSAGDTALFTISTDDPLARYSSASGTVFATSAVPEPASWALALAGLGLLGLRRRQQDLSE